jgi:hypothetical protein
MAGKKKKMDKCSFNRFEECPEKLKSTENEIVMVAMIFPCLAKTNDLKFARMRDLKQTRYMCSVQFMIVLPTIDFNPSFTFNRAFNDPRSKMMMTIRIDART